MNKKLSLIEISTRLFVLPGCEATTPLQISGEVDVTGPLLYFHFENKDVLSATILDETFENLIARLDEIDAAAHTPFKRLEQQIILTFRFVVEFLCKTRLIASTCPARLREALYGCVRIIGKLGKYLEDFVYGCPKIGIAAGEFRWGNETSEHTESFMFFFSCTPCLLRLKRGFE